MIEKGRLLVKKTRREVRFFKEECRFRMIREVCFFMAKCRFRMMNGVIPKLGIAPFIMPHSESSYLKYFTDIQIPEM